MANYIASSRSNYFKVKDAEAFKDWASGLSGVVVWDKEDAFALAVDDDCGAWPSDRWVEEANDWINIDFAQELSVHLQDDQVAVLMEVGAEKLRYLVGTAEAINAKGESIYLSLSQIYGMALEKFGIDPTLAEF